MHLHQNVYVINAECLDGLSRLIPAHIFNMKVLIKKYDTVVTPTLNFLFIHFD